MTGAGRSKDFIRGQVGAVSELLMLGEDDAAERLWEALGLTDEDLDVCEDCEAVPLMSHVLEDMGFVSAVAGATSRSCPCLIFPEETDTAAATPLIDRIMPFVGVEVSSTGLYRLWRM